MPAAWSTQAVAILFITILEVRNIKYHVRKPWIKYLVHKKTIAFVTQLKVARGYSLEWRLPSITLSPFCEKTSSRVCMTVSNSPNPSRAYISLCKRGKNFL